MFDILLLGTGASVPSRDRALPCAAVRRGPDVFLFDCGEGSQRQIMVSPFSFMRLRAIFITHLHGDHFYGLPGLLQTMGLMGRTAPLVIAGPIGLSAAVLGCLAACPAEIGYDIATEELDPGDDLHFGDVTVTAFATDHGVPSLGFVLREDDPRPSFDAAKAKSLGIAGPDFTALEAGETVRGVRLADVAAPVRRGQAVAYTGDTVPGPAVVAAVKGVDVLIHEATFLEADRDHAVEHHHSTAKQAAEEARAAGCGALVLVHISNRYKDPAALLAEAQAVFPDTWLGTDLALYHLTRDGLRSA